MSQASPSNEAGFTLVEVMVAVALFALIGIAGFTLVDGIVGVQRRTEGRLERLADLQRAMHILTSDLEQAQPLSVRFDGTVLSLQRSAGGEAEATTIAFTMKDGALHRLLGTGSGRDQILVPGVRTVAWQALYEGGSAWATLPAGVPDAKAYPRAIALELTLADEETAGASLRRVVALPRPVHE